MDTKPFPEVAEQLQQTNQQLLQTLEQAVETLKRCCRPKSAEQPRPE